jgi:pimeloyl-ACP methyl ester carboxylesterase
MEGLDFEQKLSTISCPTLVLCGENDSEAFIDAYELFAKNIPGVSHALINNAGHFINEENPTDLASKISEFLLAKNN